MSLIEDALHAHCPVLSGEQIQFLFGEGFTSFMDSRQFQYKDRNKNGEEILVTIADGLITCEISGKSLSPYVWKRSYTREDFSRVYSRLVKYIRETISSVQK